MILCATASPSHRRTCALGQAGKTPLSGVVHTFLISCPVLPKPFRPIIDLILGTTRPRLSLFPGPARALMCLFLRDAQEYAEARLYQLWLKEKKLGTRADVGLVNTGEVRVCPPQNDERQVFVCREA